jgi:Mn2+/Fe2+ NRAMP family transporter
MCFMVKMMRTIKQLLAVLGPGIFAIGYTIGTGSVTSMAKAGSQYGLQLVWVLFLSCLFSGVLMEAYGRMAAVTGDTALHAVKRHLPFGRTLAILILLGVVTAQYTCLGGILTLSSGAIYETLGLFVPSLPKESYAATLGIAVALIALMYGLLMIGRYSFFEKVLAFFVMLMGLTFIISMFVVWPSPAILRQAVIPSIPDEPGALLMIAAFVGTTMAAPTFVTRPLLLKEKGVGVAGLKQQTLDAVGSAPRMCVLTGPIRGGAAGARSAPGRDIVKILDMVHTLEPVAGKFAVALFMAGTLSAGLSSIFPILMVGPLLISDYRVGRMEPRSRVFRQLCLAAAGFGLIVPALGGRNPVAVTVMAQISNVFVLPLAVAVIIALVNRRALMGKHRAGPLLNAGLALAGLFACIIAATGLRALLEAWLG